ncbi:echinoidin-like [Ptychodera flava]|uniref:echinoidin-like n=1 Tax=Ptychodera flava TaxID=63121 RepID=UPI00396A0027
MDLKLFLLLGCMALAVQAYNLEGSFVEQIDGDCMCMVYEVYCQQPDGDQPYNAKARQFCRQRSILPKGPKGRLAILNTAAIDTTVRDFIKDLLEKNPDCITKYGFWIGLFDREKEGEYYWIDGVALCDDFRNYAPGEPNNNDKQNKRGQDCTQLWYRFNHMGLWDDEYCNFRPKGIVCEIPDPYCHFGGHGN